MRDKSNKTKKNERKKDETDDSMESEEEEEKRKNADDEEAQSKCDLRSARNDVTLAGESAVKEKRKTSNSPREGN